MKPLRADLRPKCDMRNPRLCYRVHWPDSGRLKIVLEGARGRRTALGFDSREELRELVHQLRIAGVLPLRKSKTRKGSSCSTPS